MNNYMKKIFFNSLILTIILGVISYYNISFNDIISCTEMSIAVLVITNSLKAIAILFSSDEMFSTPLTMDDVGSNEGPPQNRDFQGGSSSNPPQEIYDWPRPLASEPAKNYALERAMNSPVTEPYENEKFIYNPDSETKYTIKDPKGTGIKGYIDPSTNFPYVKTVQPFSYNLSKALELDHERKKPTFDNGCRFTSKVDFEQLDENARRFLKEFISFERNDPNPD